MLNEKEKRIRERIRITNEILFSEQARMANSILEPGEALFSGSDCKKNFKKFIESQSQEDVIEMFEAYKANMLTRDEYATYILGYIVNFIKACIKSKGRVSNTQNTQMSEFICAGIAAVMNKIDSYDPHQTVPSSYFKEFINQYTRDALSNDLSKYYINKIIQLDKEAKRLGFTGCDDPNCPAELLADATGISLTTILEAVKEKNIRMNSYDVLADEGVELVDERFATPEEAALQREKEEMVIAHLNKLTPLQKYVVWMTIYSDEKKSNIDMIKILNLPENRQRFGNEYPSGKIDQRFVNQIKNAGLLELKQSAVIRNMANMRRRIDEDAAEQASYEELVMMMKLDDLSSVGNLDDFPVGMDLISISTNKDPDKDGATTSDGLI